MFPNVRLMLVAMLASIVAIACGLGLFAAFRVNHDPLTRLAKAGPPLQLVFTHAVPAPAMNIATAAAPFGARFQADAPPYGGAEANGAANDQPPAPMAAPGDDQSAPAPQTATATSAATDRVAAVEEQTPSVTAAKAAERSARKPIRRHRLARRRQPRTAVTSVQPAYQWTPAAQSSQRSNPDAGR